MGLIFFSNSLLQPLITILISVMLCVLHFLYSCGTNSFMSTTNDSLKSFSWLFYLLSEFLKWSRHRFKDVGPVIMSVYSLFSYLFNDLKIYFNWSTFQFLIFTVYSVINFISHSCVCNAIINSTVCDHHNHTYMTICLCMWLSVQLFLEFLS